MRIYLTIILLLAISRLITTLTKKTVIKKADMIALGILIIIEIIGIVFVWLI